MVIFKKKCSLQAWRGSSTGLTRPIESTQWKERLKGSPVADEDEVVLSWVSQVRTSQWWLGREEIGCKKPRATYGCPNREWKKHSTQVERTTGSSPSNHTDDSFWLPLCHSAHNTDLILTLLIVTESLLQMPCIIIYYPSAGDGG